MSRFNSPEEVIEWAEKAAKADLERHLPVRFDADGTPWQYCLNPYLTVGARADWQEGFDNAPPRREGAPSRAFNTYFQRGRAARRLLDEHREQTT